MDHATDPMIGRVLDGRYRVGPRIARGGMAAVYEATDLRLDRTVAVKVMHAGLAEDDDFVARFEREARSAARLAHHNVVAVFDQGDDNGTLFLVMEYVPGRTLRDVIRADAPMTPARALALLDPVLSALAAAHQAGMIHRDVKPENVLLADRPGSGGAVKVADFGLARAINAETQHTATGGVLIGTVSYLAPELVVDGKADARADVYATGVLLYEMLTGRKPHQADTPIQVAYKHVHEDIPAPSTVVPAIPAYVDALVARATSRDRTLRPADAGVLLHQVRRVRHALDQGVTVDDELTADLAPAQPRVSDETDVLPAEELAALPRIIDPADAVFDYDSGPSAPGPALGGSAGELTGPVVPGPGMRPAAAARPASGPVPPEPPRPRRPGRRRRGRLVLAALVVVLLLVGLGGWYFGVARYTVTPGVLDRSEAAARTKVEKAGLHLKVTGQKYSETVARGAVMETDPDAGARIRKGGTVEVVLSRGPERHDVPKVAGMSLDQAQAAIQDAHLTFGRSIAKYSEKVPQGEVITTDPRPGTPQRRDTAVDVVVSKGKRPIKVPDYTGKSAKKAEARLTKLGFEVDAGSEQYSDTVPKGRVITQSPDGGTGHKGDQITLVVSRGPELVTLPDVRRDSYDDARAQLEALGLVVQRDESDFYIGLDRVAGMNPPAGTKVRKGTKIRLILV